MKIIKCQICEKYFNMISLSNHIKKHKISVKEYYNKFLKKDDEGFCLTCGKETRFEGLKNGYLKSCSIRCFTKTEIFKYKCQEVSKRRWQDKEYKHLQSKKKKELWQDKKSGYHSEKLKKAKSQNSRKYMLSGGASYVMSFNKNPSKPQVDLYNLVKSLCKDSILNFPIYKVNRNIDIAIPSLMIAIEYDGSYWHQDKEKDRIRQEQIESLGWKFIRYRDYIPTLEEISLNIEIILNEVLD